MIAFVPRNQTRGGRSTNMRQDQDECRHEFLRGRHRHTLEELTEELKMGSKIEFVDCIDKADRSCAHVEVEAFFRIVLYI